MTWYETIIACHQAVTDKVSHYGRMKSERYFVWQEDGDTALNTDNRREIRAVTGSTDLFTKTEFDPWCEQFEKALNDAGVSWRRNPSQYEEETGIIHHEWDWQVPLTG